MSNKNKGKGCVIILVIFLVIGIIGSFITDKTNNSLSIIESAKRSIEKDNYQIAITELETINKEDSLYTEALKLINHADSLHNLALEKKKKVRELENQKIEQEKEENLKEQIKREIASIDEGIDFSGYRKTVDQLQFELVLFGGWAKIVEEGEQSKDLVTQKLTAKLKAKISKIQIKEFPLLRKEYSKIINAKMWENDIEVSASGRRKNYINFTGSIFTTNKNKQLFQKEVQETLKMFRFTQSRYRWYEGENKYTYYTIYKGKDSDLVFF
ncbi:hypothetical protein H2O64_20935 [Kordia sp. YSTF-M3]|uniref:Uncharacterized protein n=1 Tax=Kordia aestuariivivens TaxID=2759037 RepID=A0ABR7QFF3_9FLAO|nr:hypothetical protein [Kordia aestuariivivens]MBC8757148.1 hypothetical protein [Kordia aestuariivivens]